MNKKTGDLVMRIVRIKINIGFILLFSGAVLYSATVLNEATKLREICFWSSLILMFTFQIYKPIRTILDLIEERFVNGRKDENK